MIEIQVASLKDVAAILAGIAVPLEDVVPGKFYFLLRKPIEKQEDDDPRNSDLPRDRIHHLMLGRGSVDGKIEPARKVVGREIILQIGRNDLRVALIEQGKGATRRADIDRLPEAIKHEHLSVE